MFNYILGIFFLVETKFLVRHLGFQQRGRGWLAASECDLERRRHLERTSLHSTWRNSTFEIVVCKWRGRPAEGLYFQKVQVSTYKLWQTSLSSLINDCGAYSSLRKRKGKKSDEVVVFYTSVRKCPPLRFKILLSWERFKTVKLHYMAARPHMHCTMIIMCG